jgi:hypothetical protein
MFLYLGILTAVVLYNLDFYQICKTYGYEKYKRFQSLQKCVSTQYKNKFTIFYVSLTLICKLLWFNIVKKIDTRIEILDKNKYIYNYMINGKHYKMVLDKRKGPELVYIILDENNNDLTNTILPYLGPKNDWHGSKFTPKFFGANILYFELSNGSKTFLGNETIDIN